MVTVTTKPGYWKHEDCEFISIDAQKQGAFKISKCLLENHYTKKNIDYLYALRNGASQIIDTDDDNFPYIDKWSELLNDQAKTLYVKDQQSLTFKNIYTHFSNSEIPFWPRGFLDKLTENSVIAQEELALSKGIMS